MKKIIGFQNKGGLHMKKTMDICDEELIRMLGKREVRKLERQLRKHAIEFKYNKLVYYTAEEVFDGIQKKIDKVILENEFEN